VEEGPSTRGRLIMPLPALPSFMIRITFLGTAAARPTVTRNVSATMVQREGDLWLLDCGEGTQRQMMRYGTGFGIRGILVTHLHGDHILGITGLLRTMALQGREAPLPLYGPPGSTATLEACIHLGGRLTAFPTQVHEVEAGHRIAADPEPYEIEVVAVRHGVPAVGFVLREHDRPGRFDVETARGLGVPEGPLFGRLHRGESVMVEGREIRPEQVVGPARPGRSVAFSGDTRPTEAMVEAARGAELLVHDATFSEDEADRARQTWHATAAEAARVGARAGVKRLALTHVSARYSAYASPLQREAAGHFPGAFVPHDGQVVEIGYPDDPEPEPAGARGARSASAISSTRGPAPGRSSGAGPSDGAPSGAGPSGAGLSDARPSEGASGPRERAR
jgi:ribonuclease Z